MKGGRKSSAMVASVDVPATLLDYAGIKPAQKLSGLSLRPALNGGTFSRDASFSSWNDGRVEALFANMSVEPYRAVRTQKLKYILWESGKQALYQLDTDPFEEKNLANDAQHAGALQAMQTRLRNRMKETSDPAVAWFRS